VNELYKRMEDHGRLVLMVPRNALTTEEKNGLRNQPGLLVDSTHDHFLVSTEEADVEAEAAPLPPTKPTDPDSPEALLNPANPESQQRAPEDPAAQPELDAMTVAQLKAYASDRDIDLSGAKTKADMATRIREQEADAHTDRADGDRTQSTSSTEGNLRRTEDGRD
jgi:hypothetical protein